MVLKFMTIYNKGDVWFHVRETPGATDREDRNKQGFD
jgi:hypothetical protein